MGQLDGDHPEAVGQHHLVPAERSLGSGAHSRRRLTCRPMPFLKKVVVVEDEDAVAHLIAASLGDAGYLCLRARDGEEAIKMAEREDPDLMILDVLMPKMDGIEAVKRLKA